MGLLTPLYIAGGLAIGLPILFHLIRRTPHMRQVFSSLMFLSPSPPRLTRRSRLNNILLLILRALALVLLALAFARPFFSGGADLDASKARGRRVAVLIDTSASMRREDLWQQAVRQAEATVGELSAGDEVALYFFDDRVRPGMTFREWNELEQTRRAPILRARLAEATPTWAPTRLGDALATVADLLTEGEGTAKGAAGADKTNRQIVLISDLQQGAHVEALQGHQWPENVLLEVKSVGVKKPTNASLQFVREAAGSAMVEGAAREDGRLRVRVSNQADSARDQFTLAWADERGPVAGMEPIKVYVPPGRSQIVRVGWPKAGQKVDRLVLQGDDQDFDNTLYVVAPRRESVRVVYVGEDAPDDVKGLSFYLRSATTDTDRRTVELVGKRPADALSEAELLGTRLVLVSSPPAEGALKAIKQFAETGGDVVWVLKDAAGAPALLKMIGADDVKVEEAQTRDFALVARVETQHPLFAPFADPRFGDFTKIHFWKHRRMRPAKETGIRTLAWFDNGDPFLLERPVGKGRVLILTSGWHPADSQLALSTKFVPLIDGLLRRPDGVLAEAQYVVHDRVALPAAPAGGRVLTGPDGKAIELAAGATTFEGTDRPGVYHLALEGRETALAVNLSPDEGRTAPLAVEDLERWGAKVGAKPVGNPEELITRERHLRLAELENRQKLWRWLIVGVLGLLAVETALAGRLSRRGATQQQQQQAAT
jgi:hypothetical protein